MQETLSRGSRQLPPLKPGDHVLIQDQHGNSPKQWSKTGVIIEVGPYDSYIVSVDGSRQVTKRNRRYLRLFKPNTSYKQKVSESCQDPPRLRPRPASPAEAPPQVTPPPVKLVPAPVTEPLPPQSPTPAVPPLVLRRSNNEWEVAQQQQLSLHRSPLPYYQPLSLFPSYPANTASHEQLPADFALDLKLTKLQSAEPRWGHQQSLEILLSVHFSSSYLFGTERTSQSRRDLLPFHNY